MIAQVFALVFFGGIGAMMIYVGLTQMSEQQRLLATAQKVDAEIIGVEVRGSKSGESRNSRETRTYEPVVRFRYSFGGVAYESDRLRPTIIVRTYPSHAAAQESLSGYTVGSRVVAHASPHEPGKAFLIAEPSSMPLMFVVIGVAAPLIAWLVTRFL